VDDYDISDEKSRKIVGKSGEKSKLITCEMVMNYLNNRGVLEETDETEFMRSLRKRFYYAIDTVVGPIPMKSKSINAHELLRQKSQSKGRFYVTSANAEFFMYLLWCNEDKMPLVIELAITAAFVAFAAYVLYTTLYSDSARSKGISDSYLNLFPEEATVGEVLDGFFANGKWENYEQDGVTFVHYSGECVNTQTGEELIMGIYFKLKEDKSFSIDRMTMDGETMNLLEQYAVLSKISDSYCKDHGIASSNAFDELENALDDALADSSSSVSMAEPESETVSVAESTVYDEPEEYTQNQTESDSTGYEIHQNSLAEDIYISIGDYTSGNMTEEQKAEFRSYGENAFYSAWQDAMYSDVYRCWGRYGYLVAWEQFGDYLDFYEGIFGSERLKDYDSIYNNAPTGMETDDEDGYYVDEVLALAEKNNADMIFN
jgi:hypothetical protein